MVVRSGGMVSNLERMSIWPIPAYHHQPDSFCNPARAVKVQFSQLPVSNYTVNLVKNLKVKVSKNLGCKAGVK